MNYEPPEYFNTALCITPRKKKFLQQLYNLTPEEYDHKLKKQEHKCAICRRSEQDKNRRSYRSLCVDHCHKTRQVRGLLCNSCNKLLGFAEDNPVILLKAIQYLKGNLGYTGWQASALVAIEEIVTAAAAAAAIGALITKT